MTMRLVGWAIIHSLWQGGVIALATAAILAVTRRAKPQLRYAISLLALSLMIIAPLATAVITTGTTTPTVSSLQQRADVSPSPSSSPSSSSSIEATSATDRTVDTAPLSTANNFADTFTHYADGALPWLVAAWILGLLISSARLVGGFAKTRRITRKATSAASSALVLRVEKLCERLGITRAIRLLESTSIDVPLVIGAIRPVIVVPASLITGLTPLQLDMLLAHELAHIRRHDYLINLAQTVVETLLFYHPAARWISDRVREERENCCDDIAIAACGGDAGQYTTTLLVLEESRGQGFGLAAAASGGSLLRRAERLMTGRNSSMELGPRWIAGVLTIAAALFTGNKAIAGIQSSFTPVAPVTIEKDSTRRVDNSRAAPSSVTKAPLTGNLDERWKWAERNGGSGSYWVGYLVGGDETGKSRYYASEMPVRIDGGVTVSGRMSLGDGDLSNFIFYGIPLSPLVGSHSPNSSAMFFLISNGVLGRRIERVHSATFSLPAYFNRQPLIWLDSANDRESLSLLRSLMSRARDEETRRDIVAAIGIHQDRVASSPILIDILESRDAEGVRREAAQWLGHSRETRAMTALSNAARNDRASGVREEAIEAFGHMDTSPATDTLIAFATSLSDTDRRRTAVEALGNRKDDRALDYLRKLARTAGDDEIRMEAVEAITDLPEQRGADIVIDLAQHDPDTDVRRKAVESLARLKPASRALQLLENIIRDDPDESVRGEAIEAIGEVRDPRSLQILEGIVRSHRSYDARQKAMEMLGESKDPSALRTLEDIVTGNESYEIRSQALEAYANSTRATTAVALLNSVVDNDRDFGMRMRAVELLEDVNSSAGVPALRQIVKSNKDARLRDRALEILNDK